MPELVGNPKCYGPSSTISCWESPQLLAVLQVLNNTEIVV